MRRKRPSDRPREVFLWSLRPYYRQIAGLLALGSVGGIVMNLAVVLPAVLLGRAVNVVLAAEHHRASTAQVGWAALVFVGGTAATELPRIGKRYWLGVARTRFRAAVRCDALRGVLAWPMHRLTLSPVGDVMARAIGDVDVLGTGVGEVMVETWDTLLFSASIVATMFFYDASLTCLALAPVPLALWLAKRSGRMVAHRTTLARESESELTSALRAHLGSLRLLRLFGRRKAATAQIQRLAGRQASAELAVIRLDEALGALYAALLFSGVVFIVWLGGRNVVAGAMSVGSLVAFLALFARFVTRAPRIPQMANRVQAAGAAYRRLAPLLAPPLPARAEPRWSSFSPSHVSQEPCRPQAPPRRERGAVGVCFRRVSFSYPGSPAPALIDVDLEVAPGALVAVTGAVGSGKSALALLAAGLYPPERGTVALDGLPAALISPAGRAEIVGYVGEVPQVFSGTVAANVTFWSTVPSTGLSPAAKRAVALAALEADVEDMADGPDSEIGEFGARVSGGQRQRIALARALAAAGRPPGLLVLDDPFSAVDVHTEAAIMKGLRATFGPGVAEEDRVSILLCSHRLASFVMADLVVVLDSGRVLETGTHHELLAAGGVYARIMRAQARVEAVAEHSGVQP
jgi:ATP-binding cassette subfamily B multidrug efflux pump